MRFDLPLFINSQEGLQGFLVQSDGHVNLLNNNPPAFSEDESFLKIRMYVWVMSVIYFMQTSECKRRNCF